MAESRSSKVVLCALAVAAGVALGMVLSAPAHGAQQLHVATAPATRVVTSLTAPVREFNTRQQSLQATAGADFEPSFEYEMPVEATFASDAPQSAGLLSTVASLMLIPAAVVAGYLVGRKAPAAAATAGSIEWEDHFAMMATAGVESVEDIADLEEVGEIDEEDESAAPLEKSYANIIAYIEKQHMKEGIPEIFIGDTVKVGVNIVEGVKSRVQAYQGTVIANRGGKGYQQAITVRAVLQGVGVERVFPLHTQQIAWIEIIKRGRVRRSKLYYLRDRVGKSARIRERFDRPFKRGQIELPVPSKN